MTTTVQAPQLLADIAGEPVALVQAVARALRPTLFPVSTKGGGRGLRHVNPDHLTALTFGLALHGISRTPAPDLPRLVRAFLELGINNHISSAWLLQTEWPGDLQELLGAWSKAASQEEARPDSVPPASFRVFPYSTAGSAFAGLVDWISRPEGRALRLTLRSRGAVVDLIVDRLPEVRFHFPIEHAQDAVALFDRVTVGMFVGHRSAAGMARIARIRVRLLEALADAWEDTQQHTAATWSPTSPGEPSSRE